MKLTRDNKSSCEREVTLAPGQSLPRGSSLSRVHVNRPIDFLDVEMLKGRDGRITTDIYYKPTYSFNYITFDSGHPRHKSEHTIQHGKTDKNYSK